MHLTTDDIYLNSWAIIKVPMFKEYRQINSYVNYKGWVWVYRVKFNSVFRSISLLKDTVNRTVSVSYNNEYCVKLTRSNSGDKILIQYTKITCHILLSLLKCHLFTKLIFLNFLELKKKNSFQNYFIVT